MKINSATNAAEALKMGRGVVNVFNKHNLYCPKCKGVINDTIGQVAFNKGLDPDQFIKELNESLR